MSIRTAPSDPVYLDFNAGAPLHPRVVEALSSFLSGAAGAAALVPANPSSKHSLGRRSRAWMTEARDAVAASLGGADPSSILFVSSGTEANQTAIRDALTPSVGRGGRPNWVLTSAEHDSVRLMCEWARARGIETRILPVDAEGRPDAAALGSLVDSGTKLISVIWVNNETGVIADLETIARAASSRGIPLHLDGAQAWGKLPVDVGRLAGLGVRYVAVSGHKIGALPGTGILWSGSAIREPLLRGRQESGARGGTENILGVRSVGIAAGAVESKLPGLPGVARLRDGLEKSILRRIPRAVVNGAGAERVANTLSVSIPGVSGAALVAALDLEGFCVSTGSACSSGISDPSHVILAMGRARETAAGTVRISLGTDSAPSLAADLERFAETLERIVRRMEAHG